MRVTPSWVVVAVVTSAARAPAGEPGTAVEQDGVAALETTAPVERLLEAMRDRSYKVRVQAAILLGRSADGRAVQPLLDALERDSQYTVRAAAATALGALHEPRAAGSLVRRVGVDPQPFVREEARRVLAALDRAEALPHALSGWSSPEPAVRKVALAYVLEEPSPALAPVLATALADIPEIAALARSAVTAMPEDERLRFLGGAVDHPEPAVRKGAVEGLAELGTSAAAERVIAVYDRDLEDEGVRLAARDALRAMRELLPLAQIVEDATRASEKHRRARALRLLGCVGGAEAERVLIETLADDDRYLRGMAVMALGELGDPAALPSVEQLAADPDNESIMNLVNDTLRQLRTRLDGAGG